MLKKNKHKIIIYSSVKLSKLVNSPLFRTSRYLDWLIKGHSGLYRARPPYTQVYRHLGLDLCQTSFTRWSHNRLFFPRGSQVSLGVPFKTLIAESKREKKKILREPVGMMTNANGDWLTTKCTSTLLENVSRDGIRVSERHAQISARAPRLPTLGLRIVRIRSAIQYVRIRESLSSKI